MILASSAPRIPLPSVGPWQDPPDLRQGPLFILFKLSPEIAKLSYHPMWRRPLDRGELGGSGATGAAISGADTRLGRRCRYSERS